MNTLVSRRVSRFCDNKTEYDILNESIIVQMKYHRRQIYVFSIQ